MELGRLAHVEFLRLYSLVGSARLLCELGV